MAVCTHQRAFTLPPTPNKGVTFASPCSPPPANCARFILLFALKCSEPFDHKDECRWARWECRWQATPNMYEKGAPSFSIAVKHYSGIHVCLICFISTDKGSTRQTFASDMGRELRSLLPSFAPNILWRCTLIGQGGGEQRWKWPQEDAPLVSGFFWPGRPTAARWKINDSKALLALDRYQGNAQLTYREGFPPGRAPAAPAVMEDDLSQVVRREASTNNGARVEAGGGRLTANLIHGDWSWDPCEEVETSTVSVYKYMIYKTVVKSGAV